MHNIDRKNQDSVLLDATKGANQGERRLREVGHTCCLQPAQFHAHHTGKQNRTGRQGEFPREAARSTSHTAHHFTSHGYTNWGPDIVLQRFSLETMQKYTCGLTSACHFPIRPQSCHHRNDNTLLARHANQTTRQEAKSRQARQKGGSKATAQLLPVP
jgi:hypothetical protein